PDLLLDATEGLGGLHVRHRDAHDVGTDGLQRTDLGHGGGHIVGVGIGHALHGDGCIATDRDRAYPDLAGGAALDGGFAMHDCSALFAQPQVGGLGATTTEVDRLSIEAHLGALHVAETHLHGHRRGQVQALALTLELRDMHLTGGIGNLHPAVGD